VVGVQVGEEMPAPLPVRKASATKLLAKYQTSYQK
jgi:hypothetical protein